MSKEGTVSPKRPLAESLRPQSLDDFIGQSHFRQRLRTLMQSKDLPSLLLFGPPGCGKSTVALLLAKHSGKSFVRVSAPDVGITALRKQIQEKEILILDELHRYSKVQQDFFLPLLETGELTLIATTTENPSFSVTRQLLSRLHVLRLRSLGMMELIDVGKRGMERLQRNLPEKSLELLATLAGVMPGPCSTWSSSPQDLRTGNWTLNISKAGCRSWCCGETGKVTLIMNWPRP